MPRKPRPAVEIETIPMNTALVVSDLHAMDELKVTIAKQIEEARVQVPDLVDQGPETLWLQQNFITKNTSQFLLESGRVFTAIKAYYLKHEWPAEVQKHGYSMSYANGAMNVFARLGDKPNLLASTNHSSKLLEFLTLNNDQLTELDSTGGTGSVKLDEIDKMSRSEMKATIVEEKAKNVALKTINTEINSKASDLATELEMRPKVRRFAEATKGLAAALSAAVVQNLSALAATKDLVERGLSTIEDAGYRDKNKIAEPNEAECAAIARVALDSIDQICDYAAKLQREALHALGGYAPNERYAFIEAEVQARFSGVVGEST